MGHVQDLWHKTVPDLDKGGVARVKTHLHGKGNRYRARYTDHTGAERSKSFPDRSKKHAEEFLADVESGKRAGTYIDPKAGDLPLGDYATAWLRSKTFDEASREALDRQLRNHINPPLGRRPLAALTPTDIRGWDRELQQKGLSGSYRLAIFITVQAILDAAMDDGMIRQNPCRAKSVTKPQPAPRRITPWSAERVRALHAALPSRMRVTLPLGAGLGLRQGETFGLALDDIDFVGHRVHIVRQVKILRGRLCFGPPKGGRTRDVPLPDSVAHALNEHITAHPPHRVTLPWQATTGPPVTAELILTNRSGGALRRNSYNGTAWSPAFQTVTGAKPTRSDGFHALRHFYASALLDAGESIAAVSRHLGHADPGFTLRTYTHLMPASQQRTRQAIDGIFPPAAPSPDGTSTA
ncbi:MAG: tyrosine-type recombinase/integrase [Pseudonocardiaceae bacterium]